MIAGFVLVNFVSSLTVILALPSKATPFIVLAVANFVADVAVSFTLAPLVQEVQAPVLNLAL